MSGHSKWATIKRKKGATDAKRGQLFTKLIKEITVAARMGGDDPNGNPRLRTAIAGARSQSMPNDNIERAIKKGTGELEGVNYEEIMYEGYGPAGVALIIESLTDNKNRTVSEIRNILSKKGGNLGEAGSVSWGFKKKGILSFDKKTISEEKLMETALEAGAEDIKDADDTFDVETDPQHFEKVKEALAKAGLNPTHAEIAMIPENTIKLNLEEATKMLALMEALEDHDDIQKVYANFDIPADVMEKIS
ncbi:MAG TPA: YebC/PmpR family DNA-binding transcriptional regulator [Deltaproteobacteria bacterium]|nr:MAG: transcriptional regulator [Deltaproteobacteria bacterium GWA2_45_12]HBF12217.1 YebC/PmpR family DNA-binding transcriptional regulator [Deltaproteobacteria bacterium]